MKPTRWCLPLIAACSGCISDNIVRGGTSEQAQLVESELEIFLQGFRVSIDLPSVTLRTMAGDAQGKYNTVSRRIVLEDGVSDEVLVHNLRHELCHAVDIQTGFGSAASESWTPNTLFARTNGVNRREGFARVCAAGAVALGAVQTCVNSALETEIARLQEELLTPEVIASNLTVDWRASVDIPPGESVAWVGATSFDLVIAGGVVDTHSWLLDGSPVPPDHPFAPLLEPAPRETPFLGSSGSVGWQFHGPLIEAQAGDLYRGTWDPPVDGRFDQLLLVADGEVVSSGCVREGDHVFYTSDGVPWLARQEGTTLRWGVLMSD